MIELHIGCHAQTHAILFGDDRAAAQAELDKLVPLLGRDKWGSNGKRENPTHTIKAPTGDVVVVLEKIETARLFDSGAHNSMVQPSIDQEHDRRIELAIADRKRLKDAGVADVR